MGQPAHQVTRRIRELIRVAHAGNVREASRINGVPYPTLNDLYRGRTSNPSIRTLEQLVEPYGLQVSWLTDEEQPDVVPAEGLFGLLPPRVQEPGSRELRAVLIPFAAWPLYEVMVGLMKRLESQPTSEDRPVVGEATGDAFTFRLTTFLLQPLLAAEKLGETVILEVNADDPRMPTGKDADRWVAQLRSVGEMWRVVLG